MRTILALMSFAAAVAVVTPGGAMAREEAAKETVTQKTATIDRPALVVAISVDQFSADLFAQYRAHFTAGLARLAQGSVFASGYQSHAATETCPGHSTILTGVHPARSGIAANWWFDPGAARKDKRIYCAEDETDPDSTSDNPVVSPAHLKVPTLGGWLKRADPRSLNVAVAGKDRSAMMMGGKRLDAAYWWRGSGFETLKGKNSGKAAQALNSKVSAAIGQGLPALTVPQWCQSLDRAVAIGGFTIGTGKFDIAPQQASAFGQSPHLDIAVADLAISLVDEMKLGRDDAPDVLSIGLSATDYIGHAYGHGGVEMCIQMAQVDKTIGRVMDELDARGIDYIVVLTADHGGLDAPERLQQQGYSLAGRLDDDLETENLAAAVSQATGVTAGQGPLLLGGAGMGDLYISRSLSEKDREAVTLALIARLRAHSQVAAVFTARQLESSPMPKGSAQDWSLQERVRASFNKDISGDLKVALKRGILPFKAKKGLVATHGSPWDYDRRVPIVFWRKGLSGFEQPAPVETVDIAPTLASLLGLNLPEGTFDGQCLDIDGSSANICRQ